MMMVVVGSQGMEGIVGVVGEEVVVRLCLYDLPHLSRTGDLRYSIESGHYESWVSALL